MDKGITTINRKAKILMIEVLNTGTITDEQKQELGELLEVKKGDCFAVGASDQLERYNSWKMDGEAVGLKKILCAILKSGVVTNKQKTELAGLLNMEVPKIIIIGTSEQIDRFNAGEIDIEGNEIKN